MPFRRCGGRACPDAAARTGTVLASAGIVPVLPIDAHLRTLRPLLEEGGFIPTVDHTVPPDVSWPNFRHYVQAKAKLLAGKL